MGPAAYDFVDFLARTGQRWWQVLPLVPTARGNSPYTGFSAFAGNPLLISPEGLLRDGWLTPVDVEGAEIDSPTADFDGARALRRRWLFEAFQGFHSRATGEQRDEFEAFRKAHAWWLDDFALYMAISSTPRGEDWTAWDDDLVRREPATLAAARAELADQIRFAEFVQFQFLRQWHELKRYANERNVGIFGDIPIFVAFESADVWQHQELFYLDEAGRRTVVAGVPPDYFSETGQLWGNPLYRWDVMQRDDYRWWVARLRHSLDLFDLIRLDHFRGFEAYWEVPADAETAIGGQWVKGPGAPFFRRVQHQLGDLPLVAEDLGLITAEVNALRDDLNFPGMRVFEFGFDDDYLGQYHRPHSYPSNCVAYTGTHDNNTAVGWYDERKTGDAGHRVRTYLSVDGKQIHWDMMHRVSHSAADTVVFPMQDILGLDANARMNIPGVSDGNWGWRLNPSLLTPEIERRLATLTRESGRTS